MKSAVSPYLTLTISAGFPTIPPKKPVEIILKKVPFVLLLIQKHTDNINVQQVYLGFCKVQFRQEALDSAKLTHLYKFYTLRY